MNLNTYPQPLSKQDSKRAYSTAAEQIETLWGAAMVLHDMVAAERLLHVATTAVRAVHSLWNDAPPATPPKYIYCGTEKEFKTARATQLRPPFPKEYSGGLGRELRDLNREMLRQRVFSRETVIPLLADGNGRISTDQIAMRDGILCGEFKTKGLHKKGAEDDEALKLIEYIEREFGRLLMTRNVRDPIEAKIQRSLERSGLLKFLTRKSRVLLGEELVWNRRKDEVRREGSPLYKLANPELQLRKEINERLESYSNWLRDADWGDPRSGFVGLNEVDEVESDRRAREIESMTIEDTHLRRGLRKALGARYSTMLPPAGDKQRTR